jgi:hypothetical protein
VKEGFAITDILRLEVRAVIEAIEVAALWLPDSETVEMKIALAGRCGDGARQFEALVERLGALGVPLGTFDPRHGGYSKLYAFFRSLQTTEERSAAGLLTVGRVNLARFEALAAMCQDKGDAETAQLYSERLMGDGLRQVAEGRRLVLAAVPNEESQARARRATYRTLEVVGEIQDPALLRKFLTRSVHK